MFFAHARRLFLPAIATMAAAAGLTLAAAQADAHSTQTFKVSAKLEKYAELAEIRSSCKGGPVYSLGTLNRWMIERPRHGFLRYGPAYRAKAQDCGGVTLWKRRLYYIPARKGRDRLSIRFPDDGVTVWRITVR
ncbi:MAG: hypothetical protein KDJ80_14725 [Nitratireductor sp.]|nr:hypothetical protein [Nitratireductor sp.]